MKIVLLLLVLANISWAESHDLHAKHKDKEARPDKAHKKFKPTDDLKIRMEKIISILREKNNPNNQAFSAKNIGDKIEVTVNDIFKNCKLATDADEAIHPVLGEILDGASDLKNGKTKAGHEKIHNAITRYEKIFSLK